MVQSINHVDSGNGLINIPVNQWGGAVMFSSNSNYNIYGQVKIISFLLCTQGLHGSLSRSLCVHMYLLCSIVIQSVFPLLFEESHFQLTLTTVLNTL